MSSAFALDGPSPITFDGGPLGPLQFSLGADGYVYALSGAGNAANPGLLGTDKSVGDRFLIGLFRVVQYVHAMVDHKIGLDKPSRNFGAALFAD